MYDITNVASFEKTDRWATELDDYAPDCLKMLVGNKSDLESSRAVGTERGLAKAKENGMLFIEGSAKSGAGVDEAFKRLLFSIHAKSPNFRASVASEGSKKDEGRAKFRSIKLTADDMRMVKENSNCC